MVKKGNNWRSMVEAYNHHWAIYLRLTARPRGCNLTIKLR